MSKCTVMKAAEPATLEKVGKLIRGWVNSGNIPDDKEALKQLIAAGVEFDGNIEGVKLVPYGPKTVVISLPPKGSLDCIYGKIANDKKFRRDYSLGAPFIGIVNSQGQDKTPEVMEAFYDFRLGEYSLQHCE